MKSAQIVIILSLILISSNCEAIKGQTGSDGKCYAYNWTAATTYYAPVAASVYTGTIAEIGTNNLITYTYTNSGSFTNSYWNGKLYRYMWNGTAWAGPTNVMVYERQAAVVYNGWTAIMTTLDVPANQTPQQYWPTGPPAGCQDPPPCQAQLTAKATQCGGAEYINMATWDYATCTGTCLCTLEKMDKEISCGGAQYLENWDNSTCTGNCFCENNDGSPKTPTSVSKKQISDFCGGESKVESWSNISCTGECSDCSQEYADKQVECGVMGVNLSSWNEATCTGDCNIDCSVEFAAKEQECGLAGVDRDAWNNELCEGPCNKDCTTEYKALEKKCGIAGIAEFDNQECSGICKDCTYTTKTCAEECGGNTGLYTCKDYHNSAGEIIGLDESKCECGNTSNLLVDIGGAPGSGGMPQAGDAGGNVVTNPDGSKTETLSDGRKVHYSKDGSEVTVINPDGSTQKRKAVPLPEGGWAYVDTSTDANGNYRQVEQTYRDGQWYTTNEKTGVAVAGTNTGTVEKENTTVISGNNTNTTLPKPVTETGTNQETAGENYGKTKFGVASFTSTATTKTYTQSRTLNFQPIHDSMQQLNGKFPMSLFSGVTDQVDRFNAQGKAPVFELDLLGFKTNVDLNIFNPIADLIKTLIGIALTLCCIFLLLRLFGAVK